MTVVQPSEIELVDVDDFRARVLPAYAAGRASQQLPADCDLARSILPPGTGEYRDFSLRAPKLRVFIPDRCFGCMECVNACPDTAILAKALPEAASAEALSTLDPDI